VTSPRRGSDHWFIHRDADGRPRLAPDRETLTERLIREAQEAGRFDDLPGHGRPLVLDDDTHAGEMALANLVLRNAGALEHEFVLATKQENRKHAEEMRKNPDMEHEDPNMTRVAASKTRELVWRFTRRGTFEFGCLIPGHYEVGMFGTVVVK